MPLSSSRILSRISRWITPNGLPDARENSEIPFGSRLDDLDWIDVFARNVSSYVRVRREDNVLIKLPLETYAINATGIDLLDRVLQGETIKEVALRAGVLAHPNRIWEIHTFFCDIRDLLSRRLNDGESRFATSVSPFTGSFTRYPVVSELALTYRCNLACRFCYAGCNAAGAGCNRVGEKPFAEDPVREMTREQVLRVIEIIAHDAKAPSISFTGGEPSLCPHLPEYIAHARHLGLRVNLITNGTLCASGNLAKRLVDAGLHSAQVSLEGPDASIHDALTQNRGSFDNTIAGIQHLQETGISVHTNTTVCSVNAPFLTGIIELAGSMKLPRVSMNHVIPAGSAADDSIQIPYTQIGEHVLRARDHAQRNGMEYLWYSPSPLCIFNPLAHGLGNKGCAACDGLLHVSPTGDVLPCSSMAESVGNILEADFTSIWFGERAQFYKRKQMAHLLCRGCERFAVCQGACVLYWRNRGYSELFNATGADGVCHVS